MVALCVSQIEVYKAQHDSDQDEIRRLMNRQVAPQPQLQIVYPVIDQTERTQQNRWRQQQQRRVSY